MADKTLTAETAAAARKALEAVPGVTGVTASEGAKEISVTLDPEQISPEKVIEVLAKIGITAKQV